MSKRGYGISENTKSEGVSAGFEAGINENLVLVSASYGLASTKEDADPNGFKALIFEFEGEDEKKFRHLEFEINEKQSKKGAETLYDKLLGEGKPPKETKAEYVEKQIDRAYEMLEKRIKHIMTKFMDETETIIPPVKTYEQYATLVSKLINSKNDGRKLRGLFVYDKSGYVKFPSFPAFLEVMEDGVNTKLAINPRYHNMVKPNPQGQSSYGKPASTAVVSDDDDF